MLSIAATFTSRDTVGLFRYSLNSGFFSRTYERMSKQKHAHEE
jgi:hypothetical protein